MILIRKKNPKYKLWLKRRNEKIERRKLRKRKRKKNIKKIDDGSIVKNGIVYEPIHETVAPKNFSIIENPKETISFFNEILYYIKKKKNIKQKNKIGVSLDMQNITSLTIDSIMYLIAIIRVIKLHKRQYYSFDGNFPVNNDAKLLLKKSGFLKYVRSNIIDIKNKGKNIEIQSDNKTNQQVAKEICDFVNNIYNTDTRYTRFLYNMIIELMQNTDQHAYENNSHMYNYWFIFAENDEDIIKFTFLDTGVGIPKTINKKFLETVDLNKNDSEYIISALNGEYNRSKTKKEYRGKGLPTIYEYHINNAIQNLTIVSNKGYCCLDNKIEDMNYIFQGTLFYWEINKNNIEEEFLKND